MQIFKHSTFLRNSKQRRRLVSLLLLALLSVVSAPGCAPGSESGDQSLLLLGALASVSASAGGTVPPQRDPCENEVDRIALFYTHTANYSTYRIDWATRDGAGNWNVLENQISVSGSQGLRSVQTYSCRILAVDSSAGTKARLLIYNPNDLSTPESAVRLDDADGAADSDYAQEMVIADGYAYVAMQGNGFAFPPRDDSTVAVVDLTDIENPQLDGIIALSGRQGTNAILHAGYVFVTNQDWNQKVQATVSIINPQTRTEVASVNVGQNPSDFLVFGNRVCTYDGQWFSPPTPGRSITCFDSTNPASPGAPVQYSGWPDYDGNTSDEVAQFKGGMAANDISGYVLLSPNPGGYPYDFFAYEFNPNTGAIANSRVDANYHYWMGADERRFYRVHNGDKSTSVLSAVVEDRAGNLETTLGFTRDAFVDETLFWPNPDYLESP